jgi:hypothetical protein
MFRYDPFAGWRSPPWARRSGGRPGWGAPSTAQGAYGEGAVRPISYRSGKGPCSRQRGGGPRKRARFMSIWGGPIDISCRCWATCVRRASRRPLNKFIEDVATGKSAKVERTDKECGKSIMRGGLGKNYTRQKRKPSTSLTGKDPLRPLGVPPKPCREACQGQGPYPFEGDPLGSRRHLPKADGDE